MIVQIRLTIGTQTGGDLLQFGNATPNIVYVGKSATPYERKPDMREQC